MCVHWDGLCVPFWLLQVGGTEDWPQHTKSTDQPIITLPAVPENVLNLLNPPVRQAQPLSILFQTVGVPFYMILLLLI